MRISVIVPTHNRRTLLFRLLKSLLHQSLHRNDYEIILVCDGSTDGTADDVRKLFSANCANLHVIEQPHRGPAAARNAGARLATGQILAFTDDDCIASMEWLEKLIEPFEDESVVAAEGQTSTIKEHRTPLTHEIELNGSRGTLMPTCNVAYRRAAFEQLGGFHEGFVFPHNEDVDLAWRIVCLGKVVYAPEARIIHPPRHERFHQSVIWIRYLESEFLLFTRNPVAYRKHRSYSPWVTIYWKILVICHLQKAALAFKDIGALRFRFFVIRTAMIAARCWHLLRLYPIFLEAARNAQKSSVRTTHKKSVEELASILRSRSPNGATVSARSEPRGKALATSQPLVSVIIAAYNAERFIGETLKSVLSQTHRNIEVIVVDDGSTDSTNWIVQQYVGQGSRVRLFVQQNAGVGAARNLGIRKAIGKYIAPIDADDTWHSTKLEKQVACIEAGGEQTGLVYCLSELTDEHSHVIGRIGPTETIGKPSTLSALIAHNFVGNASVPLLRKSALEQVGGYLTRADQEGAQGCEDWHLSIRIAERYQIRCVPEYLVRYRQVTTSMTVDTYSMARSFDWMMKSIQQNNRALPNSLFAKSAGHFYQYLGEKSYWAKQYRHCIRHLSRAIYANPAFLRTSAVQLLFAKATAHLVFGPRVQTLYQLLFGLHPSPEPIGATVPPQASVSISPDLL